MTREVRNAFWNRAEMAERMGNRPPDHRLVALLDEDANLGPILDVGCAGGRNVVAALERGHDAVAFDAADAMVEATRARVATLVGDAEAERRVQRLDLLDLGGSWPASVGPFPLVVALGVLQDLPDEEAFRRVLAQLAALTAPGGRLLVANFGADSQPQGVPLRPVKGHEHVYLGFGEEDRRMTLPDVATLDGWARDVGFVTDVPTEVVRAETEAGFRTTLNALYRLHDPR